MLKRLVAGLFLLVFAPFISAAADVQLNDVIKTLETPFNNQTALAERILDFKAEFFQESHVASINRVQRGQGKVSFKFSTSSEDESPIAKFRWEDREPSVQEIISDGRIMWVYLPDNRQVIESDISQINAGQGENPVTFLSGLGNLSRDFLIDWGSTQTEERGNYLLHLEPRRPSQFIQQMEVVVRRAAVLDWLKQRKTGRIFPILSTLVTDANGNRTAIEFRDMQVNQKLSEQLFHFEKPEDVELMKPDEQWEF
jgi:outer membrane lipoprotein carrier protein